MPSSQLSPVDGKGAGALTPTLSRFAGEGAGVALTPTLFPNGERGPERALGTLTTGKAEDSEPSPIYGRGQGEGFPLRCECSTPAAARQTPPGV